MRKKKLKHSCAKVRKKNNYPKFVRKTFDILLEDMGFYNIPLDLEALLRIREFHNQLHIEYDSFINGLKNFNSDE